VAAVFTYWPWPHVVTKRQTLSVEVALYVLPSWQGVQMASDELVASCTSAKPGPHSVCFLQSPDAWALLSW
jgi:hypothetical protein